MRLYSDRQYFFRSRRGISGFQEWGAYDYGLATGATLKSKGIGRDDIGMSPQMGNLNAGRRFRLDDGHLPEYQPRATFYDAGEWVKVTGRVAWILPAEGGK